MLDKLREPAVKDEPPKLVSTVKELKFSNDGVPVSSFSQVMRSLKVVKLRALAGAVAPKIATNAAPP